VARLSKEEALKVMKNRRFSRISIKRLNALRASIEDNEYWTKLCKGLKRKIKKDLTND